MMTVGTRTCLLVLAGAMTLSSGTAMAQSKYYARERIVGVPLIAATPPSTPRSCTLTPGTVIQSPSRYKITEFIGDGRTAAGIAAGKAACEGDPKKPQYCYVARRSDPADCGGPTPCSWIYGVPKGASVVFATYAVDSGGECTG
jgi:hypothetical protein